jgi:hypothetical protein
MKKYWIIYSLFSIMNLACDKSDNDVELQNDVVRDVFMQIIDSVHIDRRVYTLFPENGKSIYDKNGKWLGFDSTSQNLRNKEWEQKKAKILQDTSKLVIGFDRLNFYTKDTDYLHFYRHFKNLEKGGMIYKNDARIFPIDLSQFVNSTKFNFKNREEYKICETKNPSQIGSIISFSNAYFDISRKFGFINTGVTCGGDCGRGYIIFIKKIDKKWVIDKIELTWIS